MSDSLSVNKAMTSLAPKHRWNAAVDCVRQIVRYRRAEPLSEQVIATDPDGTLVLSKSHYEKINLGMSVQEVSDIIGMTPYVGDNGVVFYWTTMGGSYLQIALDRRYGVIQGEILSRHHAGRIANARKAVDERLQQGPIAGRSYKNKAEGDLWSYFKVIIFERDNYRCQYCGVPNDEHRDGRYHLDHIVPLSQGGGDGNIELAALVRPLQSPEGIKARERVLGTASRTVVQE